MSQKETIYIPAEPVSTEEISAELDAYRIMHYQHQLECIRVSDLTDDQKRIQSSFIHSRLRAIENARIRG